MPPDPDYPETGFGEINGDLREADFWLGIICGLRSLSSILLLVVAPDPELSATTFIPSVWREVKIVVGRVHKVDVGTNELNTCERRYLPCLL